jgi:hypothetical protein
MTPTTAVSIESEISHDRSYVDWAAIVAGTVIATAITLVLTGFGSGIGLSMTSPFEGKGFSGMAIAIGLWVIWVAVTSLMAGSYVTGRIPGRPGSKFSIGKIDRLANRTASSESLLKRRPLMNHALADLRIPK